MELVAAVLMPPSNVERQIVSMQEDIFTRYGLSSAIALPVIMPFRFLLPSVSPDGFRSELSDLTVPLTLSSANYEVVNNALYINIEVDHIGSEAWMKLNRRLESLPLFPGTPPIPEHRGFFLCRHENETPLDTVATYLPTDLHFRFKTFHFGLLSISISDQTWDQLTWKIMIQWKSGKPHPLG